VKHIFVSILNLCFLLFIFGTGIKSLCKASLHQTPKENPGNKNKQDTDNTLADNDDNADDSAASYKAPSNEHGWHTHYACMQIMQPVSSPYFYAGNTAKYSFIFHASVWQPPRFS
jgi:hypothetical protein